MKIAVITDDERTIAIFQMAEAIADCEALLCGGIGRGAYESMKARNIKPVVTDIPLIDEAVLDGTLVAGGPLKQKYPSM